MSIKQKDLIELIIRPSLESVDLYSVEAEKLLAGTCAQESSLGLSLAQTNGPALGIWQIEPKTHRDIYYNYLTYRGSMRMKISAACYLKPLPSGTMPPDDLLIHNLRYSCIMARIIYLRAPKPLPAANDVSAQAAYWKRFYNTYDGKGNEKDYIENFDKYLSDYYNNRG